MYCHFRHMWYIIQTVIFSMLVYVSVSPIQYSGAAYDQPRLLNNHCHKLTLIKLSYAIGLIFNSEALKSRLGYSDNSGIW